MELDAWGTVPEQTLSLDVMDKMVAEYKKLRDEYDEKKKISSDAYLLVEDIQFKIMQALEKANKKSYKVDGVGTFSVVEKQSVKIPQSLDEKRELLEYIKANYGEDVFDSMVSIHHQTLNSFYNNEVQKHIDDPCFHLPGLGAPIVSKEARFTKAK